ncbi:hypothetical protein G3I23_34295, partial [Streptomyces sp. SID10115]
MTARSADAMPVRGAEPVRKQHPVPQDQPGRACTEQAPPEQTDPELLIAASILLADAALAARRTGAELTAAGASWRVGLQAL